MNVPEDYRSFDVVSLLTNVLVKETIDILLPKVNEKLIKSKIERKEKKGTIDAVHN